MINQIVVELIGNFIYNVFKMQGLGVEITPTF